MRSQPKQARSTSFRPGVEALEGRWVPACTVLFSATGVTITGDGGANAVTINDAGTGAVGTISVTCDGVTTSNTVAVTAFAITADMLGGNDTIIYNLTGDLLTGQSRAVAANLGDRNDTFLAQSANDVNLNTGSALSFLVNGQTGRDNIYFDFSKELDVLTGASGPATLSILAKGNQDRDKIAYTRDGLDNGNINLNLNGNQDNDKVSLYDNLGDASAGIFVAQVNGQGGNDLLALVANRSANFTGTVTGMMNGGGGFDTGIASSFVSEDNVEDLFRLPF